MVFFLLRISKIDRKCKNPSLKLIAVYTLQ